jgi:group I intron endonuclease
MRCWLAAQKMRAGFCLEALFSTYLYKVKTMYYVYQHKKADSNEVFYVGKGKCARAFNATKRNPYWQNVVNKHGFNVEFIAKDIDEEFAFLIEKEAIDSYKRKGLSLVNLTDGGEGTSGFVHSEEHKEKLKGNQHGASTWGKTFKGKTHSDEQKAKWSKTRKGVTSPRKGVVLSDETRSKISASRKGSVVQKRRVLTDEQVREIRVLLPQHSIAALARQYGVGESTIRRLRDGERYAEVI